MHNYISVVYFGEKKAVQNRPTKIQKAARKIKFLFDVLTSKQHTDISIGSNTQIHVNILSLKGLELVNPVLTSLLHPHHPVKKQKPKNQKKPKPLS